MNDFMDIKNTVDQLSNETVRSYLRFVLSQIRHMKEQRNSPYDPAHQLIELHDQLVGHMDKSNIWDPSQGCTHVHIVIGDSFAGSMRRALTELGMAETHKLVVITDNYAIGPIANLDAPDGRKARCEWFQLNFTDAVELTFEEVEEEYLQTQTKLKLVPEQARIIVWTSRSVREQAGMRYAMHLLRHLPNPIHICDACAICEELYNRPDARIEYLRSGEIPPSKLQQALARVDGAARPLAAADIAQLAEEWQAISKQGGFLRIWRNGAIEEVPVDYFDSYLLKTLDELSPPSKSGTYEFIKSARLIGQALGNCEQDMDHSFFEYRVRELIYQGVLEIRGVPAAMRYYSVRRR